MEATNTFHGLEMEIKPGHVSSTETIKVIQIGSPYRLILIYSFNVFLQLPLPYPKATIFILLSKFGDWMAINGAKGNC